MRRLAPLALVATFAFPLVTSSQAVEKELVASVAGPAIERGVVSEILWDGGTLLIQSAALEPDGQLSARYFIVPGRRMDVKPLPSVPPGAERYWQMKASRVSPTGLGRIINTSDAKMPMFGVGTTERRMLDAVDMGGTEKIYELRLGKLTLHTRRQVEPYDGEVWSWSPPALNRIAYVDGKGDLWIARADGANSERIARGTFTLPAWSEDGLVLAVVERKDGGARWDVSVIHLPPRFRD